MSPTLLLVAGLSLVALVALAAIPPLLLRRSQDRLAQDLLDRNAAGFRLLTRAERVAGRFRRVPGILGLSPDALTFLDLFGETVILPTARIDKLVTGRRLSSGRMLLRREVLRVARADGEEVEFVLTAAAASAWRSHLGAWAGAQRLSAADTVRPGRS